MLSIDNVYDEAQLAEFDARIQKLVPGETIEYTVEYKVDGVAMSADLRKRLAGAGRDARRRHSRRRHHQ